MVANAVEVSGRWPLLRDYLLKSSPGRWEFMFRLALICTLTTLVTEFYQTPEPAPDRLCGLFPEPPSADHEPDSECRFDSGHLNRHRPRVPRGAVRRG